MHKRSERYGYIAWISKASTLNDKQATQKSCMFLDRFLCALIPNNDVVEVKFVPFPMRLRLLIKQPKL